MKRKRNLGSCKIASVLRHMSWELLCWLGKWRQITISNHKENVFCIKVTFFVDALKTASLVQQHKLCSSRIPAHQRLTQMCAYCETNDNTCSITTSVKAPAHQMQQIIRSVSFCLVWFLTIAINYVSLPNRPPLRISMDKEGSGRSTFAVFVDTNLHRMKIMYLN